MSETPPLEFVFAPRPARLRALRRQLRRQLDQLGVGDETADDVLLVVDEIVTNAIEHGARYRARGTLLVLRLRRVDAEVELEFEDPDVPERVVADLARRLEQSHNGPPALDAERGRGLFLIAVRFAEVSVRSGPGGGLHLRGRLA